LGLGRNDRVGWGPGILKANYRFREGLTRHVVPTGRGMRRGGQARGSKKLVRGFRGSKRLSWPDRQLGDTSRGQNFREDLTRALGQEGRKTRGRENSPGGKKRRYRLLQGDECLKKSE